MSKLTHLLFYFQSFSQLFVGRRNLYFILLAFSADDGSLETAELMSNHPHGQTAFQKSCVKGSHPTSVVCLFAVKSPFSWVISDTLKLKEQTFLLQTQGTESSGTGSPQSRLENVWATLQMPEMCKLDMAIKYSSDKYYSMLEDVSG